MDAKKTPVVPSRFCHIVLKSTDRDRRQKWYEDVLGITTSSPVYDSFDDLVNAYEARKAKGIKPFWCVNHGMSISMYYADPDGNQVECHVDTMTNDEVNAFMATPEFSQNPIGVDFDPEEFVRRVRSNLPASELAPWRVMTRGVGDTPTPESVGRAKM
ncbi:hypothetical protein M427DRAFT_33509 [Gonapodya prolifera JEL478]|uniref:VOC domain-containing protein n=1 Tax=Gonapodya prolifera (strain JEL478) TaxID=1344416 RepID=A0A139ABN9_GONPJ|nr:hypothetical protein M427DRAFT_33509 [Gonapodya prolifera JEL478]|eukprot:KXS13833.1 hypothetical protein M427DRAFT_33509 [Gonapodya prolifera JEL478]